MPFVKVFTELLKNLTGYFKRSNDRVGLVSIQGKQAQIINNPTHNFRVILRHLSELAVDGETPIADGLRKGLEMCRLERFRKPGSRNIVLAISDFYPEPLTHKFKDVFDEPAYKDAIQTASQYRRHKTLLFVLNPCFRSEEGTLPGEKLCKLLAKVSGGRFHFFRPVHSMFDKSYNPPTPEQMAEMFKGISVIAGIKMYHLCQLNIQRCSTLFLL